MTNIEVATNVMAEFNPAAARIFATQPFNRAAIAKAFRAGFRKHSVYSALVCDLIDSTVALDRLDDASGHCRFCGRDNTDHLEEPCADDCPGNDLAEGAVMVEPELQKGLTRRVFRRMLDGSLEWATYDDWRMHNERARFFGFCSRDLPASMTSSQSLAENRHLSND